MPDLLSPVAGEGSVRARGDMDGAIARQVPGRRIAFRQRNGAVLSARDLGTGLGADRDSPSTFRHLIPTCRLFRTDLIFVAALVLVCGLSVFIGIASPLGNFAHDIFFLLDNAYRVVQGQVPNRDFSSAWGPVMFLIDAVGLLLSGLRPAGIGYANALFGGLIACWTFVIVRPRLSPACACALGVYAVLLIAAPFPLANNPLDFGYAMIYNRYGFAIFGIIMMECLATEPYLASVRISRSSSGAISTGVALGLLAFLKISYGIVAVPFVAFSLLGAGRGRRLIGLCSGLALVTVLVLCYLRFDLSDMIRDLAMAAAARRLSLQVMHPIGILDAAQSILILLSAYWIYRTDTNSAHAGLARFRLILFALLTIAAGYLLLVSNQQRNTFPLNGYAAIALAAAHWRLAKGNPQGRPGLSMAFPGILLIVCFLPICLASGISLTGAAVVRESPKILPGIPLALPERDAALLFRPARGMKIEIAGGEYVEALNEGLAMLRRDSGSRDGVLAFDEFNPFNYILNRPSPIGGIAAAADDYIFSDAAHPAPERFLGNAPYVIVRKYQEAASTMERGDVAALMRIYGPALRAHFVKVDETDHWVLWRRK